MNTTPSKHPGAKKSLGQNFLQDVNIAKKIVNALDITSEDRVIEIGPGPGALTRHLIESSAKRLQLIEKDSYWAQFHAEKAQSRLIAVTPDLWAKSFYTDGARLLVSEADALSIPWHELTFPVKIIGNLPYNVASPLMWDIMSLSAGCKKAVFMIQKEVGERLVALPRTSAYGALSVWIQSFCLPKMEFIVPPQVFHPRPKVHSAVVSFTPLVGSLACDAAGLSQLLKVCFQARRKQLGNSLKQFSQAQYALELAGILPTQRPEELSPTDFHRLVDSLFPKKH